MKTARMLTICVLAFGLVVFPAKLAGAEPMGTAFTYQGRLIDKNKPADGLYDFQFKLYDSNDPCTGVQLGSPIDINDLDVIDGHFIVELDFGSGIFDGNAVWLETRVVESPMGSEPSTLRPLLELTPTPYAIYAETAGGDSDWTISGNDMYSAVSGNVGIGTTEPDEKLHVVGSIKIDDGSQGANKVLTSDADGVASWQNLQVLPGGVPSGVIVMWSGTIANIPSGWALCDGGTYTAPNGDPVQTPDLTSKFIRSVPNASTDPGSTSGSSTHTHSAGSYTASSHTHSFSGTTGGPSQDYCCICSCGGDHVAGYNHTHTLSGTTSSGGGGSISGTSAAASSLPPYYELAFIMKL